MNRDIILREEVRVELVQKGGDLVKLGHDLILKCCILDQVLLVVHVSFQSPVHVLICEAKIVLRCMLLL